MRLGVRLLMLGGLGRLLLLIGEELRLGNGLDFGAPLAEVAAEEGEGNDGADEDGEGREWKNRIHWRTVRIGLGCEGLIRVEFWGK